MSNLFNMVNMDYLLHVSTHNLDHRQAFSVISIAIYYNVNRYNHKLLYTQQDLFYKA